MDEAMMFQLSLCTEKKDSMSLKDLHKRDQNKLSQIRVIIK